jgi:hypothetical protein
MPSLPVCLSACLPFLAFHYLLGVDVTNLVLSLNAKSWMPKDKKYKEQEPSVGIQKII